MYDLKDLLAVREPKADDRPKYQEIHAAATAFALKIMEHTGGGPHAAHALDAVMEAVMWADAGVAPLPTDYSDRQAKAESVEVLRAFYGDCRVMSKV